MSLSVPPSGVTPSRDRLSRLVAFYAELPDDAAALAADVLEVVARRYDAAGAALALAPEGTPDGVPDAEEEEALTPADLAALEEGRAELARGDVRTLEQVMASLGVTPDALADAWRALDAEDAARAAPQRPAAA